MGGLRILGLGVDVWGATLLDGISLALEPGTFCGLIGPSGAGKSTLMRVLLGLRSPSRGQVDLGSAKGHIGYVPQDDALHMSLTVRDALDYAGQLRLPELSEEDRSKRILDVAQSVGIGDRLDLRIGKLSGGQRKRVAVALELLPSPPVLVLDEPTSGLDPGMERTLMKLFADLAKNGRIVLLTTHAMQSLELCDKVLVLVAGRQAFFGTPAAAKTFFRAERFEDIFAQLPKQKPDAWSRKALRG